MTINKKIQAYIENKGFKLIDISKKIGISKQNFSRILNSDDLKVSQLLELCKVLEVNPSYFFDGSEMLNNKESINIKREKEFLDKLYHNEITARINEERRSRHLIQYYYETIGFILLNKNTLLKNVKSTNTNNILKALLENVFTRYEYGFSASKFEANIVFIFSHPEELPFEGEQYDSVFKTKD